MAIRNLLDTYTSSWQKYAVFIITVEDNATVKMQVAGTYDTLILR